MGKYIHGHGIYMDIMKRQKLSLLLTWTSFIGQVIHPVGGQKGVVRNRYFSSLHVSLYKRANKSGEISKY